MTQRFLKVTGTLVLIFTVYTYSNGQAYHQVTPSDFMGTAPSGNYIAYTDCIVYYSYQPVWMNGWYRLKINVNVQVNKNRSWINKARVTSADMLAEVIKHEQGHYIFAYLMQQEMLNLANRMRFGNDFERQVSKVLNRIKAKYKQLNEDYDTDTANSTNHKQQNAWDLYFSRQLGPQYANNLASVARLR